ncbi:MAG: Gfo/Idh/MocA family oxidoreductase [Candidatus Margulisbacteria bacterium]|nr:Gfo/Idh/MocA family oxidoreductase [Candidatus Margulisiibacteriota bacterium]
MINIGIIGFGKMGQIRAKAIQESALGKVISIFDPEPIDTCFHQAQSTEEIINNPHIHAVFICTPNFLNKPLTINCLDKGKHVFCEKPPAFTAKDVDDIRKSEQASQKVLMYGFNHRHHCSIQKMKSLIDSSEYGKVLWMRGRYGKSVDQAFYNNWRSKKELAGGGILIDQGIHMLDLFLYLGGQFDNVHATVSNLYWHLEVEDNVFAILKNSKTGMVASLHSTMTQWRHLFSIEIFLERGYMVLNGLKTSSNTYGDETLTIAKSRSTAPAATWEDERMETYHSDKSWAREINEFFKAIEENRPVHVGSSQDALNLMTVIDKIYASSNPDELPNLQKVDTIQAKKELTL